MNSPVISFLNESKDKDKRLSKYDINSQMGKIHGKVMMQSTSEQNLLKSSRRNP